MKEEMIKFLEQNHHPLYCEEKQVIKEFIQTFFNQYQPERSKREDHESGCGALNIVETQ